MLVALVPFVLIEGPGASWLRDLGVLDRDEHFTELSFPERTALPTSVVVGAPIAFDVEIRNREGETTSYGWKARVTSTTAGGGSTVELAHGRVRLDDGEARRISVDGPAPPPPGAAVVRVTLVGRDEAVDFRVAIVALAEGAPPASG